jgi:hypothetical protein
MLKGENIICFGFAEWDNPYKTNQHHIMGRLAANNKVLFIESLGLRQPVLQGKDIKRMAKRVIKSFQGPRLVSENLYAYAPLVLPFHKFAFVRWFNKILLYFQLAVIVRSLNITRPIIWSYVPNAVDFIGK